MWSFFWCNEEEKRVRHTNPAPYASFSVREQGVRIETSQVNAVLQEQINMAEIRVTTGHMLLQIPPPKKKKKQRCKQGEK